MNQKRRELRAGTHTVNNDEVISNKLCCLPTKSRTKTGYCTKRGANKDPNQLHHFHKQSKITNHTGTLEFMTFRPIYIITS